MYDETSLIWLHVICDAVIAIAYFSIPAALMKLVRSRQDLKFNWIFICFAVFILACGAGHVLSVIAMWSPVYRLDGVIKLITAMASVATAAVLWPLIPKVIEFPSAAAMKETALKLLEREYALLVSDQMYRSLLEAAPVAMIIVDESGTIEVVNAKAEQIFGYSAEEMCGQPVEMLIPQMPRQDHLTKQGEASALPTRDETALVTELKGVRNDGTEFPVEINLNPLKTAKGLRVCSAIVDITQRKQQAEEMVQLNAALQRQNLQLETANQELEAFSYSVSHDLRAPLRSIDGFSKAILEDCDDRLDDKGRSHLNRVRAASQRMGQLIDDLLNLSKVSRGELRCQTTDLSQIAREVCDELSSASKDRNVIVQVAPELITQADPRLMRIVLTNLIGNAWKFTGKTPQPTIEFGCNDQGGSREYFVRDNGAGFDMTYSAKLFGAFQRLHSEKEFPGTGIGLATIRRILNRHGGSVRAESKPGEGASFYFTMNPGNGFPDTSQRSAA